jgi:hypothetical protein
MTDLHKAAEMALDALKISTPIYSPHKFIQALKALEAALAQPEPIECGYDETVGMCTNNPCCEQKPLPLAWATFDGEGNYTFRSYENNETYRDEYLNCKDEKYAKKYANWVIPLYTAPPKREWVGLTKLDIHVLKMNYDKVKVLHTDRAEDLTVLGQDVDVNGLINAIETELKEKNGG